MSEPIKVLLADDSPEYRTVLRQSLMANPEINVVGVASDGVELVKLSASLHPDLILTDTILTNMDGLTALQEIFSQSSNRPAAFIIATFCSPQMAAEATALGVKYLAVKPCSIPALIERILHYRGMAPTPFQSQEAQLEKEIYVTEVMHQMGIPAHVLGHGYLRDAILIAIENADVISAVTKELYPAIASKHGTTAPRVERAIRTAIGAAWERGNIEMLHRYFNGTISKGKPTNSEFIFMIADKLRLRLNSLCS